jgi:hypothetical protein
MGAKATRKNLELDDESTYLDDLPRRARMDPQGLIQHVVERGPVVSKLLPQRLLGLGFVEVGRRRTGGSCSRCATVVFEAGRLARDDEASAPCVGCRDITQPSSRITSTPAAGSRAGTGQLSH